jgi:hypothetical protein
VSDFRGRAVLTAENQPPVEVDAVLVARRDGEPGTWPWRGKVTPVLHQSLLDFVWAARVELHVKGDPHPCYVSAAGERVSEVEGLDKPRF